MRGSTVVLDESGVRVAAARSREPQPQTPDVPPVRCPSDATFPWVWRCDDLVRRARDFDIDLARCVTFPGTAPVKEARRPGGFLAGLVVLSLCPAPPPP
jgi:hypothetical protein